MKEILKIQCQSYILMKKDFSEEDTCDNKAFRSTILRSFQFQPEQKKCVVMRAMRMKLNIFRLQLRYATY